MLSSGWRLYAFIPGKNWRLSLEELRAFFKTTSRQFSVVTVSPTFFVIRIDGKLEPDLIKNLGGILKIADVKSSMTADSLVDAFKRTKQKAREEIKVQLSKQNVSAKIFPEPPKQELFGISVYTTNTDLIASSAKIQRFLGVYLKSELKARGQKSRFMGFPRKRRVPQLTHVEVLKKRLVENSAEILVCIDTEAFFARTFGVHDPFEFQKRDIARPIQRPIFSIPPRLARIMVNLAGCTVGKTLLDPFCGVGTILQEALLSRTNVLGIDINDQCISATRRNLDWLVKEYKIDVSMNKYEISQGDARSLSGQIGESAVDCIATEPDLGPPLRHLPTEASAKKIQEKLTPLYDDFLRESSKILKTQGKLVFVTPYIRTRTGKFVGMNLKIMTYMNRFSRIMPFNPTIVEDHVSEVLRTSSSIIDMGERHRIGREIHTMEKI